MRNILKFTSSALMIALLSASAFAHEYWFEPDSFFLTTKQTTALHLNVGEALKKDEERVFQASKTTSFQMFSNLGVFDMRTMAEDDHAPIVNFMAEKSGTYMFAMERNWSYIKIEADKFEEYLRDEGMEYIIPERARLGEQKKEGRERYSRYIKTLLQVGNERDATPKRRLDAKLEIVALDNPYTKKVGSTTKFQVYFDGAPLAGYAVFANNRDGDKYATQKMTTDKDGKITVKLDRKGIWLIRLVIMRRCEKNCNEADWESYWGALSFGVK